MQTPVTSSSPQYVVSQPQPLECKTRARASHSSDWHHVTSARPLSKSGSGSTSCTLFNSRSSSSSCLKWRRRTGPAIKQRTAEPDLVKVVVWILLRYRCSWLSGLPQTNCVAGWVWHSLRGATKKGAGKEVFASDQCTCHCQVSKMTIQFARLTTDSNFET